MVIEVDKKCPSVAFKATLKLIVYLSESMLLKMLATVLTANFERRVATSSSAFSQFVADEAKYSTAVAKTTLSLILEILFVAVLMAGITVGLLAAIPIAAFTVLPDLFPGISKLGSFLGSILIILFILFFAWRKFARKSSDLIAITNAYFSHWSASNETPINRLT